MEGIKEKNELLSEFNHPVKNQTEEQELGLGFQSLDFADQALDHELMGDQDDGLAKKLSEMAIEGSLSGEEEVSEMVFAIEMDERKSETEVGFDKDVNFRKEIGVENDQDGDFGVEGFKDSGGEDKEKIEKEKPDKWSVVEVNVGEIGGVKEGGGDKEGSNWYDNENRVGDHDLDGINNDEAKIKERISGKFSVVEGNEGDYKEIKEGGKDKEGSEWSEIKNEVGDRDLEGIKDEAKIEERKLKKRNWVEGNEGDFKEMKEGNNDKEGSKWREFEDKEENYNLEVKNKRVEKGKQAIEDYEDYEDGWGENWDDGAGRTEVNEEQQCFNNYEDERNVNKGELYGNVEGYLVRRDGKSQYDEEPHWFGNAQRDSVGLNDRNFGRVYYPLRPDAEDCSFYMRTGTCKFGPNCKFNHPLKRKDQAARDTLKQKEEIYDRPKPTECKYYLSSGGCKYGKACKFNHSKGKAAVTPNSELNFLGLPIRVGEKECPFYMRNGSCKYGSNCRFHHPDPTVAGGGDTASPGRHSKSARTLNETAPFRPAIYPPGPSAPPNAEWNGYQAPVYRTSEGNLPVPPAFSMNIPATGSNFYAHPRTQLMLDEFPERPGQPECNFYLKTGDCKYRSACKFHHPKNPTTSVTLNDHGLPLRPGQSICSHFHHYGICKFGPSCRYDHSVTNGTSVSSDGSVQGPPILYTVGDDYGEWQTESMRSV